MGDTFAEHRLLIMTELEKNGIAIEKLSNEIKELTIEFSVLKGKITIWVGIASTITPILVSLLMKAFT